MFYSLYNSAWHSHRMSYRAIDHVLAVGMTLFNKSYRVLLPDIPSHDIKMSYRVLLSDISTCHIGFGRHGFASHTKLFHMTLQRKVMPSDAWRPRCRKSYRTCQYDILKKVIPSPFSAWLCLVMSYLSLYKSYLSFWMSYLARKSYLAMSYLVLRVCL